MQIVTVGQPQDMLIQQCVQHILVVIRKGRMSFDEIQCTADKVRLPQKIQMEQHDTTIEIVETRRIHTQTDAILRNAFMHILHGRQGLARQITFPQIGQGTNDNQIAIQIKNP